MLLPQTYNIHHMSPQQSSPLSLFLSLSLPLSLSFSLSLSPTASSGHRCKTIRLLLTYILFIALSAAGNTRHSPPPPPPCKMAQQALGGSAAGEGMAAFSQTVTAEGIGSDNMSADSSTDLFAIDSSNQLEQPRPRWREPARELVGIFFFPSFFFICFFFLSSSSLIFWHLFFCFN